MLSTALLLGSVRASALLVGGGEDDDSPIVGGSRSSDDDEDLEAGGKRERLVHFLIDTAHLSEVDSVTVANWAVSEGFDTPREVAKMTSNSILRRLGVKLIPARKAVLRFEEFLRERRGMHSRYNRARARASVMRRNMFK